MSNTTSNQSGEAPDAFFRAARTANEGEARGEGKREGDRGDMIGLDRGGKGESNREKEGERKIIRDGKLGIKGMG